MSEAAEATLLSGASSVLPAALKWRIYSVRLFLRPVVEGTSVPSLEGGGGPGKGLMEGGFFLLMPPPPICSPKDASPRT